MVLRCLTHSPVVLFRDVLPFVENSLPEGMGLSLDPRKRVTPLLVAWCAGKGVVVLM